MATFCKCKIKNACEGSNHKVVHFGQKGYEDYTTHEDKSRREAYRARHKVYLSNDPTTPAQLSWDILWGDSTSLRENVEAYRKKHKL